MCLSFQCVSAQLGMLPALSWAALRAGAAGSSGWASSRCFGLVRQEKWQQNKGLRKNVPIKLRGGSKGTLPRQQCLPSAHQTSSSRCPLLGVLELLICPAEITPAYQAGSAPIPHLFSVSQVWGSAFFGLPLSLRKYHNFKVL